MSMNDFMGAMDGKSNKGVGQSSGGGVGVGVGPEAVTEGFLRKMDKMPTRVVDEKGVESLSEWGVGDQRVAMFFKLCRGLPRSTLQEFIRNIISEAVKRGRFTSA